MNVIFSRIIDHFYLLCMNAFPSSLYLNSRHASGVWVPALKLLLILSQACCFELMACVWSAMREIRTFLWSLVSAFISLPLAKSLRSAGVFHAFTGLPTIPNRRVARKYFEIGRPHSPGVKKIIKLFRLYHFFGLVTPQNMMSGQQRQDNRCTTDRRNSSNGQGQTLGHALVGLQKTQAARLEKEEELNSPTVGQEQSSSP